MSDKDVMRSYPRQEFVQKIRRFADSVENEETFRITVDGEPIYVPDGAEFSIEHIISDRGHELEFQVIWKD